MPIATKTRRLVSTVPMTMRAAAIDGFGPPDALSIHMLPVPELGLDEVLIAVHTAGVGSWDPDMRAGWSPSGDTKFPLVLGTDGSGVVVAMGSRVRRFRVDEEVYGFGFDNPKGGFYAEYVAIPAENAAPIPKSLGIREAGAIPATGLTALQGIDDMLHVKVGEIVLICGASGGVGTLAVQFAKLRGAHVFAVASGADGVELVRRLGADAAADGHGQDLTGTIRRFAPRGVDAILALAGGGTLEGCIDLLRPGGRVAYPNGVEPEPRKRPNLDLTTYNASAGVRDFERLGQAVVESRLMAPIAAEYPLVHAAKAHERMAQGHVLGKVVLRVG